jgi:hypothetical protein
MRGQTKLKKLLQICQPGPQEFPVLFAGLDKRWKFSQLLPTNRSLRVEWF